MRALRMHPLAQLDSCIQHCNGHETAAFRSYPNASFADLSHLHRLKTLVNWAAKIVYLAHDVTMYRLVDGRSEQATNPDVLGGGLDDPEPSMEESRCVRVSYNRVMRSGTCAPDRRGAHSMGVDKIVGLRCRYISRDVSCVYVAVNSKTFHLYDMRFHS
jgi:hypothetical protein